MNYSNVCLKAEDTPEKDNLWLENIARSWAKYWEK